MLYKSGGHNIWLCYLIFWFDRQCDILLHRDKRIFDMKHYCSVRGSNMIELYAVEMSVVEARPEIKNVWRDFTVDDNRSFWRRPW